MSLDSNCEKRSICRSWRAMYPSYFARMSSLAGDIGGNTARRRHVLHEVAPGDAGPAEEIEGGLLADATGLEQRHRDGQRFVPGGELLPPLIIDKTHFAAERGQTLIGIVAAQMQAMLRATGEHAIRLGGGLGDQVVDQHPDVRLIAAQNKIRPPPAHQQRRVHPATRPCAAASS